MRVRGTALWRESSETTPTWVEGEWIVQGDSLTRVRPSASSADYHGFILPGLVDVHCHIAIGEDGPVGREEQEQHALATRNSGVLAVRDCGAPEEQAWIRGRKDLPVLVHCGQHIARPKRYIRGLPIDVENLSDLPAIVAEQARVGDGWVKIVGDWIDRSAGADADLTGLWPREILTDAVAAAHDNGARVAVHAFSHRVIDDLLEAGVDDIEHGAGMDLDQLAEARARGIYVTPTLLQVELFKEFAAQAGTKFPVYAATMQAMYDNRVEHAEMLMDSGVHLLPGTDSGGYQDHGCIERELTLWKRAGMPVERILDHATWMARDALELPSLSEGAPADFLVYSEDPRICLVGLSSPAAVVLRGQQVAYTPSPPGAL